MSLGGKKSSLHFHWDQCSCCCHTQHNQGTTELWGPQRSHSSPCHCRDTFHYTRLFQPALGHLQGFRGSLSSSEQGPILTGNNSFLISNLNFSSFSSFDIWLKIRWEVFGPERIREVMSIKTLTISQFSPSNPYFLCLLYPDPQ